MNKNSIIMKVLQGLIKEKFINECVKENNFKDTARKITVSVFFKYIFSACIFGWRSYRETYILGRCLNFPRLDFSSLSLKGKNIDYKIFKTMFQKLLEMLNRSEKRKFNKKMGKVIASVDATLIKRKKGQWSWSPFNSTRDGVKLHIKMLNGISVPIEAEETLGKISDKSQLCKFYNNREIVICDRGYMKISQFVEMDTMKKKQFFIIRVTESLKLNDIIRLVTNIKKLSAENIAELYKKCWEIETFFKTMKQEFKLGKPFGKTENAVFSYLYISLIAYIVEKYLYIRMNKSKVYEKYTFIEFIRILKTDFSNIESDNVLYSSLASLCNITET